MKIIKKIGWFLLAVLIVAQFFKPEKNDGDLATLSSFVSETNPPEDVKTILENTCYDCHSVKTNYPWYNSITPVNFWLADHIKHGKGELNFSKWEKYSLKRKEHKMKEVWEEVELKKMPLDSYTWTHANANLSDEEINKVVTWAKEVQANYKQQLTAK